VRKEEGRKEGKKENLVVGWKGKERAKKERKKEKCWNQFCCYSYSVAQYSDSKVKVSMCFLTEHHAMKTYLGGGGIAPHILNLGTGWR
jgi:hypothetical protein